MSEAIDHTQEPFTEIVERLMFRRDIPEGGLLVCHVMSDGWEMGRWIESEWEGKGPIARKILAVNDLLSSLKALVAMDACNYDPGTEDYRKAIEDAKRAIVKAEGVRT